MKKGKDKWLIILVLGVFLLFIAITMAYINSTKLYVTKTIDVSTQEDSVGYIPEEYPYAFETSYSGKPYLSDKLFRKPFQKTDSYICNKDLFEKVTTGEMEILTKKTTEAAAILFNESFKDIPAKDDYSDIFTPAFHLFFADSKQTAENNEEAVALINSWYIDTKTSMESKWNTDSCLLYYDENSFIVRGQLLFTVYESDDLAAIQNAFYLDELELGKESSVILEMHFIPDIDKNDFSTYTIANCTVVPLDTAKGTSD